MTNNAKHSEFIDDVIIDDITSEDNTDSFDDFQVHSESENEVDSESELLSNDNGYESDSHLNDDSYINDLFDSQYIDNQSLLHQLASILPFNIFNQPNQPLPTSLNEIREAAISAGMAEFFNLISEDTSKNNSLTTIREWLNHLAPNFTFNPIANIDADTVLQFLKDEATITTFDRQISDLREMLNTDDKAIEPFNIILSAFSNQAQVQMAEFGLVTPLMIDANFTVVSSLSNLALTILNCPESLEAFNTLNISEIVQAINNDPAALVGLEKICHSFSSLLEVYFNNDAIVDAANTMNEMRSNALTEDAKQYMKDAYPNFIKAFEVVLKTLIELSELHHLNKIRAIAKLQNEILSVLLKSKLFKSVLEQPEMLVWLNALSSSDLYKRFKFSQESINLLLNDLEKDIYKKLTNNSDSISLKNSSAADSFEAESFPEPLTPFRRLSEQRDAGNRPANDSIEETATFGNGRYPKRRRVSHS